MEFEKKRVMKKRHLNFIIDSISLAAFLILISSGIIMRYVLPPGAGRNMTLLALDRHEWGGIHFWVSIVFIVLMVVHLILHWKWIVCIVKGKEKRFFRIRKVTALAVLFLVVFLVFAPLLFPVEESTQRETTGPLSSHVYDGTIIRGSMTFHELKQKTGVPSSFVLDKLNLPQEIQKHQRLGATARSHGIEMDDIREAVKNYHLKND